MKSVSLNIYKKHRIKTNPSLFALLTQVIALFYVTSLVLPQQAIAHDFARAALKTLSKILISLCLLANAQVLIAEEANTKDSMLSDPMYRYQWHLSGEGFARPGQNQPSFDINPSAKTLHLNVAEVWKKYKGEGIYIAIVESMNIDHEDLKANIAREYNHTYNMPQIYESLIEHGTLVAGVAAARGYNGIGVRGVAPLAKMFRLSCGNPGCSYADVRDKFVRHRTITAVSNHSYTGGVFINRSPTLYMAMETGINEGFYGKGTVYVFGAGNNGSSGDNANYNAYGNYHAGVTVCGVDYQGKYNDESSEPGANLWVCALTMNKAPPGRLGEYGIVTTSLFDSIQRRYKGYDIGNSGTSLAAPMVSGIVALMRQANRNLSWRDVKVILADSARKTDPGNKGWGQSGMKYGSFDERYHFNHKYGFGLVDAKAAVDLAEEWVNLPPREEDTVVKEEFNPIHQKEIRGSFSVESDINFIEYVDVMMDFRIGSVSDLSVELISPSGTKSTLAVPGVQVSRGYPYWSSNKPQPWRFGSSRHLGEQASGKWHLIARHARARAGGRITLTSWELRIRGYQVKLEAVATDNLSDEDQPPLILSLHGAHWKDPLKPSDFRLQNAPENLSIAGVERTSSTSTQVQLKLKSTGKLNDDYDFQVEAEPGTVSNRLTPLISNDIEVIIPPKLEVAAAADLSDLKQTSLPLALSLLRAHWKETLKSSDFGLLNATPGLAIVGVERTSSTQVQLNLRLTGEPSAYYSLQVEATTGTISDHSTPLISNAIEIARIAYDKEMYIPQVTKGFDYSFTAEDILSSPTTLSYAIKVVQIVDEEEMEMDLGEIGFTQNGPIISGTPTAPGAYYFRITATRQDDISRTEYVSFNVQLPHTLQIKVYPEGLLLSE